jgi:hypothetical protein
VISASRLAICVSALDIRALASSRDGAIMSLTKGPLDVVSEPDRPARETDAEDVIEVTDEMIEAGATAIWEEVGGAEDLGTLFSASDLARKVYLAMSARRRKSLLAKSV